MKTGIKERAAKAAEKTVNLPAGEKLEREEGTVAALSAQEIRLVMRGWEIKKRIAELEDELKAVNGALTEAHGDGAVLIVHGVCRATIASRESVRILDAERLKQLLGFRFADLVRTEISYRPEPKLQEIASSADDPLAAEVRKCLSVGTTTAVSWRAER